MFLVWALRTDEDALVCDLAETYHVLNYRELPVRTTAALAAGLPMSSRLMRKQTGAKLTLTETLLAILVDSVNTLIWQRTKGAKKGRNRPDSILEILTKRSKENETKSFASGRAFEEAWQRLQRGEG